MRLSVTVPTVVLVIGSTLLGLGLTVGGQAAAERRRIEATPRSGMAVLNAHTCLSGETKQILVLGVEDGFSPAGTESGFIRPGRNNAAWLPRDGTGEYDQVNADRGFTDSFRIEGRVASGTFVIRARSLNGSANDSISFGNLSLDAETSAPGRHGTSGMWPLVDEQGWLAEGEVRSIGLDELIVLAGRAEPVEGSARDPAYSLKSYLNDPASPGWLDVFVQDDTAIDFMGLALCRPPAVRKGTTLMPHRGPAQRPSDVVALTCHAVRDPNDRCEPYVGDTACSEARPVACFRPAGTPTPVPYAQGGLNWSGGSIAVTEPVVGSRFSTVHEVDGLCAARFGPGWRVANIDDGNRNLNITAYGDHRSFLGKVWVDVVNQPYATCWARE